MIGTRLGPYEVLAKLGAGGMGDVYRARDTKLGRDVALKTLPDAFASDPDRLARFQREARILASLNHPHIAAIYGLEEGPPAFLVLELVEGEDLSLRIARGAIPVGEALSIARQIADALEAAHDSGVIHRDLKPANVKIRSDGTVKVLDFGLAKALAPDATSATGVTSGDLTRSPTITGPFGVAQGGPLHVTGPAVILGTAPYMSPEQARGQPVDRRADVWAFGAVLYEMLTGRPAFQGHDVPDTLAAILRSTPKWSALPPGIPIAVTRLLHRTLEKDVRSRLSDMAMVRLELCDAERAPVDDAAAALLVSRSAPSALGRVVPYVAAIGLAVATGLGVWRVSQDARTAGPPVRFSVDLPADVRLPNGGPVAISPDGTHLVFAANQRLYVRALDEAAAVPIPGTEARGAAGFGPGPFFSPDGTWIAFWQEGRLRKVPLGGGSVETICDTPPPIGASWGANDEILLGLGAQGVGLARASGGTVQTLVPVKEGERALNPQMLPGGEWVLFGVQTGGGVEWQVVVQSRSSGERRLLFEGAQNARYISSGHLLFSNAGALFAQAFDADRVTLIGGPVSMLESGGNMPLAAAINFAVSATGTLLYRPVAPLPVTALTRLVLVARDGTRSALIESAGMTWYPRFSPDGSRVAYGVSVGRSTGGTSDLWVVDVARGARTRVTFAADTRFYPIWTRDSTRLTFADGSLPPNRVLSALADGSGGLQTLIELGTRKFPTSWSPDGRTLALYMGGSAGGVIASRDIWMWHANGDKPVLSPFVETTFEERGAIFSPDGRWIAYVSNKSAQNDIVARPYPGPGSEVTISVGGGQEPVWGPLGRELFYRHDNKLLAVPINVTPTSLGVGTPARVFDDPYLPDIGGAAGGMANYDISPDGKRFVFVEEPVSAAVAPSEPVRLQVILNWLDDLKRRVPLK